MEEQAQLPQKELCKAMAEAFPLIKEAVKNKYNQFLKYRYADLGGVIDALKPALQEKGLWFTQKVHSTPGYATVETIIYHASGESISCGITSVPIAQKAVETFPGSKVYSSIYDAQSYGSALTYCRKYSLSSAFGVFPDDNDDDGEAASDNEQEKAKEKAKEKKAAPAVKPAPHVTIKRSPCNQAQLLGLAKKAIQGLELDDSELDDMFAFLEKWQSKIDDCIEESVLKNIGSKVNFLLTFQEFKKGKLIPVDGNA